MILPMEKYFDKYDLIVNSKDRDGGDSCHKTCHWHVVSGSANYRARKVLRVLYKGYGILCRNPLPGYWGSTKQVMSRDQVISAVRLMRMNDKWMLFKFFFFLALRLNFMTNVRRNGATRENHGNKYRSDGTRRNYNIKLPDFAGLEIWGEFFRATYILYPLCFISDIETFLASLILRNSKETDISNHLIYVFFEPMPTIWTYLARKVLDLKKIDHRQRAYWIKGQRPWFVGDAYTLKIWKYI